MYDFITFETRYGCIVARSVVSSNLYTILDSYITYTECTNELKRALLLAIVNKKYVKNREQYKFLQIRTYFGSMLFEERTAIKLYKALVYIDETVIENFCDDILCGLSNYYSEVQKNESSI